MDSVWWFAFRGNELLVIAEGAQVSVPTGPDAARLGLEAGAPLRVGMAEGPEAWAVDLGAGFEPAEGLELHGLRRLWGRIDEEAWRLAGRAFQLLEWDRNHRYCGRCGAETEVQEGERSRTCPHCGLQHFPRLSPAVIVLIEGEGRMLLARSPHFPPGVYSTIAGFVEPGESLEQAVAREIKEEVGVDVEEIRYFGSQPWPFPNSVMIGFTARCAEGQPVRIDGVEIEDARWFSPDDLPALPSRLSIARALVDDFLARHGGPRGEPREGVWR
jgi:NAD+ diphosphatase